VESAPGSQKKPERSGSSPEGQTDLRRCGESTDNPSRDAIVLEMVLADNEDDESFERECNEKPLSYQEFVVAEESFERECNEKPLSYQDFVVSKSWIGIEGEKWKPRRPRKGVRKKNLTGAAEYYARVNEEYNQALQAFERRLEEKENRFWDQEGFLTDTKIEDFLEECYQTEQAMMRRLEENREKRIRSWEQYGYLTCAPRAELGIEGDKTSATRSGLFWNTPGAMTRIEGEEDGMEDDIPEVKDLVEVESFPQEWKKCVTHLQHSG